MRWGEKRTNEMRWDEMRWGDMRWSMKCGVWSVSAKCEVWSVKSAVWSVELTCDLWNLAPLSHKARTDGPGWRTAHASSLDEKAEGNFYPASCWYYWYVLNHLSYIWSSLLFILGGLLFCRATPSYHPSSWDFAKRQSWDHLRRRTGFAKIHNESIMGE